MNKGKNIQPHPNWVLFYERELHEKRSKHIYGELYEKYKKENRRIDAAKKSYFFQL